MLLLSECHKLPDGKIYWVMYPDTFVKVMSDSMPCFKVFFKISVFLATNNSINKNNSRSFVP